MQNIKTETELKQHLIRQQMMFVGPALIEKRLRKLMGKARYMKYLDSAHDYQHGSVPVDVLYQQMETIAEANALMSHQAQATLQMGTALYESSQPYVSAGMHVCELGCYTGAFTLWFAERHPECTIVGIDRHEHLLALASQASDLPNLAYRVWDYTSPPTVSGELDLLFSCFGISIWGPHRSAHHSLDPYNRRSGEAYEEVRRSVGPVLANWRAAAKTDARLLTSLRIEDYDTCLAVVDSAAATGWKFSFTDSRKVRVVDEAFPVLSFSAAQVGGYPNDNDLLRWWANANPERGDDVPLHRVDFTEKFVDEDALLHYRELKDNHIRREQSRTYDDMHTMRLECGIAGDRFYRFKIATTPYWELEFGATEDLSDL